MRSKWKRDIVVFLSSQTISLFGSSLVQYAIMWHITLATKSGLWMTLSVISAFVPTFLLSPFAGVFADRYDRKKIIMLADGSIALVSLAAALAYGAGHEALVLLLLVQAVRSVGSALHGPAVGAFLPQIVPEEALMRVNGLNGTIQSVIMLVSPMASGALLTVASVELIFLIDVFTAIVAIGFLAFFLKVPPHERAGRRRETGYFHDMRLGFAYIRDHRYLMSFFGFVGLFLFMITPAAFLTPLQVTRSFGDQVWRLTALEIAFSSGMMLGGLAISAWGGFKNRMRTMVVSAFLMSLCTLALGLVPNFGIYLAFLGLFGLAMPFYNTPSAVLLQEHVDAEYMGRVFSVLTMLSTSLMPLGMLAFGPLADLVSIETLLIITGAGTGVLTFLALGSKRLMEVGLPPSGSDEARAG